MKSLSINIASSSPLLLRRSSKTSNLSESFSPGGSIKIENVLSGVTTVTVGTYDKTIAERLTELTLNQKMQAFNIFSRNSVDALMGKVVFDKFSIQNQTTKYQVSSTTDSSVLGFSLTLGFGQSRGFGEGTTTILKTYESEKDV